MLGAKRTLYVQDSTQPGAPPAPGQTVYSYVMLRATSSLRTAPHACVQVPFKSGSADELRVLGTACAGDALPTLKAGISRDGKLAARSAAVLIEGLDSHRAMISTAAVKSRSLGSDLSIIHARPRFYSRSLDVVTHPVILIRAALSELRLRNYTLANSWEGARG